MSTGRAANAAAAQRGARASIGVAVAGTVWALLHTLGLLGPIDDLTFVVLGALAIAATVLGIRWHRPAMQWSWWLICAALVLFLFGGAARVAFQTLGDLTGDRSLLPDLLTLPGYLLVGGGLIGLARARRHGRIGGLDALLDSVVAALAALTCAWVFLIYPVLIDEHAPFSVRMLLAAYPAMSVFLVAIAAHIAFSPDSRRPVAYRFLLTAMAMMLTGDLVYMLADARLADLPSSLIDLPYALAYVSISVVVLHPSMRELSEPVGSEDVSPTRPRLAIVAVALGIPALVTITRQDALPGDRIALSAIILLLTGTAIWRVFRALHAHARAEARLAHQATHDVLTELPNRVFVEEHVHGALRRARAEDAGVALVFFDIDRFKLVNDTFGHSLGDELLVAVGERLQRNTRPRDLVARIGGDEFVVVFEGVADQREAMRYAESIRCCLQAPFTVRDTEIYTSASLGLAVADPGEPPPTAESLIRDADTAMYQAKAGGRNGVTVFDASMRDRAAERLALEHDLRQALDRRELHLHFQPIVRFPGGSVVGVEALLRWSHPARGLVPPDTFIPIAEDSGIIVEIGRWVLREACRHAAAWRSDVPGARSLQIAVNLSARQLRDPRLIDTVVEALADNDLPAEALWLELTESLLMENPTMAARILGAVRALGVGLSIDDFGTGYSSLAHLKRFPVDHVKIDRAFVEGLDRADSSDESLVAAIIAMAEALGMTTIAEGVETTSQEQRLALLGCSLAQGYLYARPQPPELVPETIQRLATVRRPAELTEFA